MRKIHSLKMIFLGLLLLFPISCAKQRPVKHVLDEIQRVDKDFFEGQFYYGATVTSISPRNPVTHIGDQPFGNDSLLEFKMTENLLTGYRVDPRFKENSVPIISFPIEKHVDVERQKNEDDEITHKEIENDRDKPWNERKLAKINFADGKLLGEDSLMLLIYQKYNCVEEIGSDLLDLQQEKDALNLTLLKTYQPGSCGLFSGEDASFSVKMKISFLKKRENPEFQPRPYTQKMQTKVGFFKATAKKLSKYNIDEEEEFAIHWDANKKVIFHLAPDFPKQYKPLAQTAIDNWNEALKDPKVAGKPLLELRDNSGQELGDIRYNFIVWIDEPTQSGLGGFGPSRWDPFTGELMNANVYLFAGNYRQSIQAIRDHIDHNRQKEEPVETSQTHQTSGNAVTDAPLPSANMPADMIPFSVESIKQAVLEPEFSLKKFMDQQKDKTSLEGRIAHFQQTSGRCYYPITIDDRVSAWYEDKNLSDEEIFKLLLTDTAVHELGHTLGLRHNFRGSTDQKHFISKTNRTSSVMDYLDLEDTENGQPGSYDRAALGFAYTDELDQQENYLYCTDEDVIRDPFCNRFDAGSTATEIAAYLPERYLKRYWQRNQRGKKLTFTDSSEELNSYWRHLLMTYFLPMREFADYYLYVKATRQNLRGDPLTPKEQENLMADLFRASEKSFEFLSDVLKDKSRSYYDVAHPNHQDGELLVRGTWLDKVLASDVLSTRGVLAWFWNANRKDEFTFFDIRQLQIPTLKLLHELVMDTSQPLISFLSAYRFMSEVPSTSAGFEDPDALPSTHAAEFFEIYRTDYDGINKAPQLNEAYDNNRIALLSDAGTGDLFWTRTDHLFLPKDVSSPIEQLIHFYNAYKASYQKKLNRFAQDPKQQASERQLEQGLEEIKKVIETLKQDSQHFYELPQARVDQLQKILITDVIINSKTTLLATLSKYEKIYIPGTEKDLEKLEEIRKLLGKDTPEKLSEFDSATYQKITDFLTTIFGENYVVTAEQLTVKLEPELTAIRQEILFLRKAMDYYRIKIELFYEFYKQRTTE